MEQKIQELTEKIYQEGVQKGEEKSRALLDEAQSKAATIVADAKTEAEKIIANATNQAAEIKRNTEAEIKLSGTQLLATVKQQVLDLVGAKVLDESTTKTLSDPTVLKEFILMIVDKWNGSAEPVRLDVLLPEQQQELVDAFKKSASDLLKKGVSINFSRSVKAGFRIGPENGTFKISLTDEDFAEFFKEYLRPRTRTWLFGE